MSVNPLTAGYDYPMVPPLGNESQERAGQNSFRIAQARPEAHLLQSGADTATVSQSPRPVENTSESLRSGKEQQNNNKAHAEKQESKIKAAFCTCGQNPCICIDSNSQEKQAANASTDLERNPGLFQEEGKKQTSVIEEELTPKEEAVVREMKQRDREVRAHEQAHIAAGGQYVGGGARFSFQTGPDGRQYATGGEVNIDVSEAQTPEATVRKAQTIQKAALAPASPSAQDRAVAAKAAQMSREAQAEISKEKQEQAELAARDLAAKAFSPQNANSLQEETQKGATASAGPMHQENPFPVPGSRDAPPPFSVRNKRLNLVI